MVSPPQNMPRKSRKGSKGFLIVLVLGLLTAGILLTNGQNISDWWRLHNYTPSAQVAELASQSTMTDYGRKLFYINQPQITVKSNFSKACPNKAQEQSIVLGCYHPIQDGIYVLQVTDSRLEGVEQVTAAHEMLHAAYDRLSPSDRSKIDAMLQDYYKNQLQDARVKNEIELYKKTEPNDVTNEMHSVFGTEISQLPKPLEEYYKRYFNDRAAVVGFANSYQATFTKLQNAVKADDQQLESIKKTITKAETELDARIAVIKQQQQRLSALRSNDPEAYNAAVPAYNRLVDQYNGGVKAVQNLVKRYNELVDQRNAVAVQVQQLNDALSSDVAPINQ